MSSAKTTTNHDEIRGWVEKRRGHPAVVSATENSQGRDGGLLRIDFDDPDGSRDVGLHRISWKEFFNIFDNNDLAFLRVDNDDSRFNKFVEAETALRAAGADVIIEDVSQLMPVVHEIARRIAAS